MVISALATGTCCGCQLGVLAATQSLNSREKGRSAGAAATTPRPLLLLAAAAAAAASADLIRVILAWSWFTQLM